MRYCPICEKTFADTVRECPEDATRTLRVQEGMEKFIGSVLDRRWRLEQLIGEGGMGAVFEARQISVERAVAVKLIRAEYTREEQISSRFWREARVMSALQHPNIIKLIDFGQDEETEVLYLVMELLRGRPLAAMLSEGMRFSLMEVLQLSEQLAGALAEAHAHNVVHRDLKPDNLFIDRVRGRGLHLTLLDFGIARVDNNQINKLTKTGAIQGTPAYMSPEQVEGKEITPSADLYAMGCILYELISGHEPFRGELLMQVLMAHMASPPPDLAAAWRLDTPVCVPLVELVHRLLAKSPAERPESALALLKELRTIRRSLFGTMDDLAFTSALPILDGSRPPGVPPAPASAAPAALAATLDPVATPPPPPRPPTALEIRPARPTAGSAEEWALTGPGPALATPPAAPASSGGGARWALLGVAFLVVALLAVGVVWIVLSAANNTPSAAAEAATDAPSQRDEAPDEVKPSSASAQVGSIAAPEASGSAPPTDPKGAAAGVEPEEAAGEGTPARARRGANARRGARVGAEVDTPPVTAPAPLGERSAGEGEGKAAPRSEDQDKREKHLNDLLRDMRGSN